MLYLILGPPASGKSTWVKQHAKPGDITIDYDALANTLTPSDGKPHKHTKHVKAVTKAARQAAIDTAVTLDCDVYVIHSMPSQRLIDHYLTLGAELVVIDPGHRHSPCPMQGRTTMADAAGGQAVVRRTLQQTRPATQQTRPGGDAVVISSCSASLQVRGSRLTRLQRSDLRKRRQRPAPLKISDRGLIPDPRGTGQFFLRTGETNQAAGLVR